MEDFTEHTSRMQAGWLEATPIQVEPRSLVTKTEVISKKILLDVMRFRRFSGPHNSCLISPCQDCIDLHLPNIYRAVSSGEPITFVLPAFPGKSPNPAKVLGFLPDMAERRALEFLQSLCDRIEQTYPPGAKVILCSDGRVFSDVVGMRDTDVTAYQKELNNMIESLNLKAISTFNLEEVYPALNFDRMRKRLMHDYGESIEVLQQAVRRGGVKKESSAEDKEVHRLYCGITRFLLEDAMIPGRKESRTTLQKECRLRAYAVIQRSKAWSELIQLRFPSAVRLSIHPQSCGSIKLGIRLIEPDNWQTPWHSVAVEVGGQFMLLKRSQAELLGAHLIYQNGKASHYLLTDENAVSELKGLAYAD